MSKVVLYHGDCDDGFSAAWVCAKALKGHVVEFEACSFGKPVATDLKQKDVYIVDFSFPREVLEKMLSVSKSLVLLDHHKSALNTLGSYKCCTFDLTHCGAVVAWRHFFKDTPIPEFLHYIEDNDLGLWTNPDTRAFVQGMRQWEHSFELFDRLESEPDLVAEIINQGRAIERFIIREAKFTAKCGVEIEVDGFKGLAINTTRVFNESLSVDLLAQSEAEVSSKKYDFLALWHQNADSSIKCSLRARIGVDVEPIAKKFGGGGHPRACAFSTPDLQSMCDGLGFKA